MSEGKNLLFSCWSWLRWRWRNRSGWHSKCERRLCWCWEVSYKVQPAIFQDCRYHGLWNNVLGRNWFNEERLHWPHISSNNHPQALERRRRWRSRIGCSLLDRLSPFGPWLCNLVHDAGKFWLGHLYARSHFVILHFDSQMNLFYILFL